jgi:hypothetical protein
MPDRIERTSCSRGARELLVARRADQTILELMDRMRVTVEWLEPIKGRGSWSHETIENVTSVTHDANWIEIELEDGTVQRVENDGLVRTKTEMRRSSGRSGH